MRRYLTILLSLIPLSACTVTGTTEVRGRDNGVGLAAAMERYLPALDPTEKVAEYMMGRPPDRASYKAKSHSRVSSDGVSFYVKKIDKRQWRVP